MAMADEITTLLREIRDNQSQALEMQREHMALYQQHLARVERINDGTESIQGKARTRIKQAWLLLPLAVLAILFLVIGSYF